VSRGVEHVLAMTTVVMDDRARAVAERMQKPLIVAALLTIPTTVLQLVHVVEPWRMIGDVLDWAIWLAFLAELVVMLAIVPNRGRYLFAHPLEVGIVALTPPFFLAAMQSIRVLRLLRLLRLIRLRGSSSAVFSMEGVRFAAAVALLTAVGGVQRSPRWSTSRTATACIGPSARWRPSDLSFRIRSQARSSPCPSCS
jgi:hypothetical protein